MASSSDLEPPADLLGAHGVLQMAEPVGHRRLEDVEPADDVAVPQRFLHPGEPLRHRMLQCLETRPRAGVVGGAERRRLRPACSATVRSSCPRRSPVSLTRMVFSRSSRRSLTVASKAASRGPVSSASSDSSTWARRSFTARRRPSRSERTACSTPAIRPSRSPPAARAAAPRPRSRGGGTGRPGARPRGARAPPASARPRRRSRAGPAARPAGPPPPG